MVEPVAIEFIPKLRIGRISAVSSADDDLSLSISHTTGSEPAIETVCVPFIKSSVTSIGVNLPAFTLPISVDSSHEYNTPSFMLSVFMPSRNELSFVEVPRRRI